MAKSNDAAAVAQHDIDEHMKIGNERKGVGMMRTANHLRYQYRSVYLNRDLIFPPFYETLVIKKLEIKRRDWWLTFVKRRWDKLCRRDPERNCCSLTRHRKTHEASERKEGTLESGWWELPAIEKNLNKEEEPGIRAADNLHVYGKM